MKLPNVFANPIDKVIKNNEEYYHSQKNVKIEPKKDIYDLFKYFDSNGYVNKLNVVLKTNSGTFDKILILMKDKYFVDIDNKKIYFDDIIDFEVKK